MLNAKRYKLKKSFSICGIKGKKPSHYRGKNQSKIQLFKGLCIFIRQLILDVAKCQAWIEKAKSWLAKRVAKYYERGNIIADLLNSKPYAQNL